MKYRIIGALVFLGLLILLPAVLREKPAAAAPVSGASDTLIILTPHAESIKHEFERAFQKYYFKKYLNLEIKQLHPDFEKIIDIYITKYYTKKAYR